MVLLAREVFFNDQILLASTVHGKTHAALDSDRMNSLEKLDSRLFIRQQETLLDIQHHDVVYPEVSPAAFEKGPRRRIQSTLSSLCRRLRSNQRTL